MFIIYSCLLILLLACTFTYNQSCVLQFAPQDIVFCYAEQVLLQSEHNQHPQIGTDTHAFVAFLYLHHGIAPYACPLRHLCSTQITPEPCQADIHSEPLQLPFILG